MLQSRTRHYSWNLTIGFAIWTIVLGLLSPIDENTSTAKLVGYQMLDRRGPDFPDESDGDPGECGEEYMATATGIRNFSTHAGRDIGIDDLLVDRQ